MAEKVLRYIEGPSAQYHATIANKGRNPYDDSEYGILSNFKDIQLTRPYTDTNMREMHKRCLVSVNGYIHSTDLVDDKFYVDNAIESLIRTGYNKYGILSFDNLEQDVNFVKIRPDMITHLDGYTLYEKTCITFDKPVDGCIFIFAGYIIFEQEGFFERVSDNSFYFYPDRLSLLEKYQELIKCYDIYRDLDISPSIIDDSAALREALVSDKSIIGLLTRFNTFLCDFKGHAVKHEDMIMGHTAIPNQFRIERHLHDYLPVFSGNGKLVEYIARNHNSAQTTLLTTDAVYTNLRQSYKPEALITLTGKAKLIGEAYRLTNCFMRKITFVKK